MLQIFYSYYRAANPQPGVRRSRLTTENLLSLHRPGQPSSVSEDSGHVQPASSRDKEDSRLKRRPLAKKNTRPAPRALKKKKGIPRQLKVSGARAQDFVKWVPSKSKHSPVLEEEEEEENDMYGLLHRCADRKRKRDESSEPVADVIPDMDRGSSHPATDGGPKMQAIVISGSPEVGSDDQPAPKKCCRDGVKRGSLKPGRNPSDSPSRASCWPIEKG